MCFVVLLFQILDFLNSPQIPANVRKVYVFNHRSESPRISAKLPRKTRPKNSNKSEYRRIAQNRLHPQNRLQKICGISTTWPAKVRQKRSKTHSPRRPLWRLGAPVRRPVGFVVRFCIALAGHVAKSRGMSGVCSGGGVCFRGSSDVATCMNM